jgi:hypothetical protein
MIPELITSWRKTYCYFKTGMVVMDTAAADKWATLKKRGALQGHAQVI